MKLLGDIINELVDTDRSLTAPLLKAKVLAIRIGHRPLTEWVNNEIDGYKNVVVLPEYRKSTARVFGHVTNWPNEDRNYPLPLAGLDKDIFNMLTENNINEGVSVLEKFLSDDNPSQRLHNDLPPELTAIIEKNIHNYGGFNRDLHIVKAWKVINLSTIERVVSSVRSKMLDFMLALEKEYGTEFEIEKIDNKTITTIMNNTVYNHGDGNITNTGNEVGITAKITIHKGNKEQLKNELLKHNVSEKDAAELLEIVDERDPEEGKYGKKVTEWIGKMMTKAADGSWQVGIGAAGALIAEALKAYYGG
jgi:hypothetical protein